MIIIVVFGRFQRTGSNSIHPIIQRQHRSVTVFHSGRPADALSHLKGMQAGTKKSYNSGNQKKKKMRAGMLVMAESECATL